MCLGTFTWLMCHFTMCSGTFPYLISHFRFCSGTFTYLVSYFRSCSGAFTYLMPHFPVVCVWGRGHIHLQSDRGIRSRSFRGGYPDVLRVCWMLLCFLGEGTLRCSSVWRLCLLVIVRLGSGAHDSATCVAESAGPFRVLWFRCHGAAAGDILSPTTK